MLIGALAQYFFGFTICVLSSFLVLLVLVQRGRGGGLTGALGGPGGQSAFGTKAGDLFTRITIGVAAAWILLCATAVFMLRTRALPKTGSDSPVAKGNSIPGASSGTTETKENSATAPIDLSNLTLPKNFSPDLKSSTTTAPETTTPAATTPAATAPAATTPEATAPAATTPAPESSTPAPAATTPAAEPTAPAATGSENPPAPK